MSYFLFLTIMRSIVNILKPCAKNLILITFKTRLNTTHRALVKQSTFLKHGHRIMTYKSNGIEKCDIENEHSQPIS